jgi:predicted  nucleic acid-binding Zn-ribbon protein
MTSYMRKCRICGNQFEATHNRAVYCSNRCKIRSRLDKSDYYADYQRKYYLAHREKALANSKRYRSENIAKVRAVQKRLYEEGRPVTATPCQNCGATFVSAHRSRKYCSLKCAKSASNRRFRANHPRKFGKEYNRRWHDKHREQVNKWHREWYAKHHVAIPDRQCRVCNTIFSPSMRRQVYCSKDCRHVAFKKYMKDYQLKNHDRLKQQRHDLDLRKAVDFYKNNPTALYMPERQAMVDTMNIRTGYGEARCKKCGRIFNKGNTSSQKYCKLCADKIRGDYHPRKTTNLSDRELLACANIGFYMESGKMEKIDLDTLKGLPSEHKDAIIEALFNALKAKKVSDAQQPKERKVTKNGTIILEVSKMASGEKMGLEQLIDRTGLQKLTVIGSLYKLMCEGYIAIDIVKLLNMPADWLELNTHRKKTSGYHWHKKK